MAAPKGNKFALGNQGGSGGPAKYKREFCTQAKKLCDLGATDQEIADFFDVTDRTIREWRSCYKEFASALKVGKEHADERVKRSLFQRATGFEHPAVKISFDKEGNPLYAPYREFVVPDTTACIFWLKNRDRENWRDKQDVEHSGNVLVTLADRIANARKRSA